MKALHPPRGFTVVEDELCRASFPLQKENAYFLEQLKLSTVIVVALEDTDDFLSPFCMENNIELHILPFVSLEEANVIGQFQNWLAAILQVVLGPRGGHSLLLGSDQESYDALIIACIRRLQHWALPSVLEEFRLMAGRRAFDLEQFIEMFDPLSIKLPNRLPQYLVLDLEEEDDFPSVDAGADGGAEAADRRAILFPRKGQVISADVKYNKNLSLVTDETED